MPVVVAPRSFHVRVTDSLLTSDVPDLDDDARDAVHAYVARRIDDLPPHLALGITALALLLAATGRGRVDVRAWEASPIPFVPLYVRMLRSLVLFAAYEGAAPLAAMTPST